MGSFSRLANGIWALLRRRIADEELDAELHAFLEAAVDEKMRSGMSREEATRAARLETGLVSTHSVKERVRDIGWEAWIDTLSQDLRYAGRTLRRNLGFASVTIVTLALGIGATVAIFTVLEGVLFRSLPYDHPERIVRLRESSPERSLERFEVLPGSFLDWRERSTAFEALAIYRTTRTLVTARGTTEQLQTAFGSPALFDVFGAIPVLGRGFLPEEGRPTGGRDPREYAGHPEVVISHRLWLRKFAGAVGVLLANVLLDLALGWAPPEVPRLQEVGINLRILGFAPGLSVLISFVFTLAPWLLFKRGNADDGLKSGSTRLGAPGRARPGAALLGAQVALSLALLFGAGLLIQSFLQLRSRDLGMDPSNVWAAELAVPLGRFAPPGGLRIGGRPEWERLGAFYPDILDHVRTLPGVESAALVSVPPTVSETPDFFRHVRNTGVQTDADRWPAVTQVITPEYFDVLRVPLLGGRSFTTFDKATQDRLTGTGLGVPGVAISHRTRSIMTSQTQRLRDPARQRSSGVWTTSSPCRSPPRCSSRASWRSCDGPTATPLCLLRCFGWVTWKSTS
jgi:hypothetical protein